MLYLNTFIFVMFTTKFPPTPCTTYAQEHILDALLTPNIQLGSSKDPIGNLKVATFQT